MKLSKTFTLITGCALAAASLLNCKREPQPTEYNTYVDTKDCTVILVPKDKSVKYHELIYKFKKGSTVPKIKKLEAGDNAEAKETIIPADDNPPFYQDMRGLLPKNCR